MKRPKTARAMKTATKKASTRFHCDMRKMVTTTARTNAVVTDCMTNSSCRQDSDSARRCVLVAGRLTWVDDSLEHREYDASGCPPDIGGPLQERGWAPHAPAPHALST